MKSIMRNAFNRHFHSKVAILCIVALVFTFITPAPVMAQNANNGWSNVLALSPGSTIIIKAKGSHRKEYKVVKVSEDSITVSTNKGEQNIQKSEIVKLAFVKRPGLQVAGASLDVIGAGMGLGGEIQAAQNATTPGNSNKGEGLMLGGLGVMVAGLVLVIIGRGKVIYSTD